MSLPGNLTTITVTGSFVDSAGNTPAGTVTFDPGQLLTDAGYSFLFPPITVSLDSGGQFSVAVPCTDNTGLTPAGFTYTITTELAGMAATSFPGKSLPHTLGVHVDLAHVIP